jgi:PPOX class probable F420-dependent enzyme
MSNSVTPIDTVRARSHARPRPGRQIPSAPGGYRLIRWGQTAPGPRSPRPATEPAGWGPFTMLTTYRRDGSPVHTPVWAAAVGDRLYVRSKRAAGKVRRLGRDPRAIGAPCSGSGRRVGEGVAASGRLLAAHEEAVAAAAFADQFRKSSAAGLSRLASSAAATSTRSPIGSASAPRRTASNSVDILASGTPPTSATPTARRPNDEHSRTEHRAP